MKEMTINLAVKVKYEDIADLLCSALEGGSTYWAVVDRTIKPRVWSIDERPVYKTPKEAEKNIDFHYMQYYPLNVGGGLLIKDIESDDENIHRLDLASIKQGLIIFMEDYPQHYADFKTGNADQNTADVFLQCCLFCEIIYG